jgi:hypothetical protein
LEVKTMINNDLHKKKEIQENESRLHRVRLREKKNDSVRVPSELFERGRHLSSPAKWLYITLKSFAVDDAGRISASYRQLRRKSGLTHSSVAKRLDELECFGWLERTKSPGLPNGYILTCPSLRNPITRKEVGDQIYPTEKLAEAWASTRRR